MKFIEDIDIKGKKVFIRVDFNVPMKNAEVSDDTRIKAGIETIEYALANNAVVVLASHLGRPKSAQDTQFSMKPVSQRLSELLKKDVKTAPDCIGSDVENIINSASPGDIIMLENLRFYKEEKEDNPEFAEKLAGLCDVYVNNAFAVCHRKNASVSKITEFSKVVCAGHLLKSELETYNNAVNNPKRPLAAVIGGAKVSSKLSALKNIMNKVDSVFIGGAMANTFFAAKGYSIGDSLHEKDMINAAKELIKTAEENNVKLFLPVDGIIAEKCDESAKSQVSGVENVPHGFQILDIGPETEKCFKKELENAATIVWNGPMGVFELDKFSHGTFSMAENIASSDAYTIIGGGDTDAAVHKAGYAERIDYISTGGGAFLTLMEGKPLAAVQALESV
ncbi:MAG: phosphoglycerate kinase [Thermodesulfobacteriota bacterium]